MKIALAKIAAALKHLAREEAQDLVEYALVVALIAFAATAGARTLATNINSAFTTVGSKLTSAI